MNGTWSRSSTHSTLAAALLLTVSTVQAVPFAISAVSFDPGLGYGVDSNETSGTLLDVSFSTSAFTPLLFDLTEVSPPDNSNSALTFVLGTVSFQEPNSHSGILDAETDDLGVSVDLVFSSPAGINKTATATGTATTGSVSDGGPSGLDYRLDWDPVPVSFGSRGLFEIDLADLDFFDQGTQSQAATIRLLALPVGERVSRTVPVPATLVLAATGITFIGFQRRRQHVA
jgi:hypothetical protein